MPNLGLRDIPLENITDESLGLTEYIDALSEFIIQCETPLTIALQGDWGSGKTSLMNLIQTRVKPNVAQTVWFNSWQYSQFGMQNDLALSMIYHFVNELGIDEGGKVKNLLRWFTKVGTAFAIGVASTVGQGEAAKNAAEYIEKDEEMSGAMLLNNLKKKLDELVKKKLGDDGKNRIVVFVDDLDRLLPEKAVELLEVFKLFLEIPGCVYVLACDYHVIQEGLKKKFGLGSDALKGKSFFDKIIQLPFSMPIGQYNVPKYLSALLKKIGIDCQSEDLRIYQDLINDSVGFNPRAMKRLFNSLQLLLIVAGKKNLFNDQPNIATKNEKQRIMFGALCMQLAYEPVYRFLQRQEAITQELFELLKDERKMKDSSELAEVIKDLHDNDGSKLYRLARFMETFFETVQLGTDSNKNTLSTQEASTLRQMLSFSALTSTDASVVTLDSKMRSDNRAMAKSFIEELNSSAHYSSLMNAIKDKFKIYQPRDDEGIVIYFDFRKENMAFGINFWFSNDSVECFTVARSAKSLSLQKSWFDREDISTQFPALKYDQQGWHCYLWKKIFDADMPRMQREQYFKAEVVKTLDFLLPKFAEDLSNNA